MLLNVYYQYHSNFTNMEEPWKCHGTVLPLSLGPFATAQDSSLPCQRLSTAAPPLGTTRRGDTRQLFSSRPDSGCPHKQFSPSL